MECWMVYWVWWCWVSVKDFIVGLSWIFFILLLIGVGVCDCDCGLDFGFSCVFLVFGILVSFRGDVDFFGVGVLLGLVMMCKGCDWVWWLMWFNRCVFMLLCDFGECSEMWLFWWEKCEILRWWLWLNFEGVLRFLVRLFILYLCWYNFKWLCRMLLYK